MKRTAKRPWTRSEKWLWAAPLLFILGAGAAVWGPNVARRALGRPLILQVAPDGTNAVRGIALSADGSTVAASGIESGSRKIAGGRISFWDARTLEPRIASAQLNAGLVPDTTNYAFVLAPDGETVGFARIDKLLPGNFKPFTLFDVSSGRALWKLNGSFWSSVAHFSPDGKAIGVTRLLENDVQYRFMRASDGALIAQWASKHVVDYAGFVWVRNGKSVVSVGTKLALHEEERDFLKRQSTLETHDLSDGKLRSVWLSRLVMSLDASSDGRQLAVVTAQFTKQANYEKYRLALLDAATGRELWRFGDAQTTPLSAKISPDGQTVAVLVRESEQKMVLLHAQTGAIQRTLFFPGQNTSSYGPDAAWSPDGKRLFAFNRNAVLVWDLD